jgi:hypothetical protein
VKAKGTIFAVVYRRIVPRLGHAQAIGAITHRLCRLIWKILHERVRYEERGPAVSVEAKKVRARKMIRELRSLGYRDDLPSSIEQSSLSREIFDPGSSGKPPEINDFRPVLRAQGRNSDPPRPARALVIQLSFRSSRP